MRASFAKQRIDISSPLGYFAIANELLLPSRGFLKILTFWGEAQYKTAIELGSTGERWEFPFPPWGTEDMAQIQGAHRCPWGQDQHWLLCLKVCAVCFHKALAVLSREWRIISFNPVPIAALDTCLACATHIKPTGAVRACSESEVQKEKKEG